MSWQDLTKQQKLKLLLILLVIVSVGIMWVGSLIKKEFTDRQKEITQIHGELNDLALAELELDNGQAIEQLRSEKQTLEKMLPPKLGALMLLKNAMANYQSRNPIEFILLKPQEVQIGEITEAKDGSPIYGPSILPVRIRFVSDYTEMVRYLHYLENQNWLLTTKNLAVKSSSKVKEKLESEVVIAISLAAGERENSQNANDFDLIPAIGLQNKNSLVSEVIPTKGIMFGSLNERTVRRKAKKAQRRGSSLPFQVEGLWQEGIVVDGELYREKQRVKGWKIVSINLTSGEVKFSHGNSKKTVKVEQ